MSTIDDLESVINEVGEMSAELARLRALVERAKTLLDNLTSYELCTGYTVGEEDPDVLAWLRDAGDGK